jgi:hypothetical protein
LRVGHNFATESGVSGHGLADYFPQQGIVCGGLANHLDREGVDAPFDLRIEHFHDRTMLRNAAFADQSIRSDSNPKVALASWPVARMPLMS